MKISSVRATACSMAAISSGRHRPQRLHFPGERLQPHALGKRMEPAFVLGDGDMVAFDPDHLQALLGNHLGEGFLPAASRLADGGLPADLPAACSVYLGSTASSRHRARPKETHVSRETYQIAHIDGMRHQERFYL